MLLNNLSLVDSDRIVDIQIKDATIASIENFTPNIGERIRFDNAIAFPGLINSHDHLDFNCFPQLGNKKYANYVEWGEDIQIKNKSQIDSVLKIPQHLRIEWGMYKNLLNGVTTVVNHGPRLEIKNNLINVWQDCHVLHSVQLEKRWKLKLNWPFSGNKPFAIHIGEGTDTASRNEIDKLLNNNYFHRKLMGIHAIAMSEAQAKSFNAIVWCPDSNYFLIGKTASIDKLKSSTKILFGTDSTVSANWNLWEHLRLAQGQKMLNNAELFESLTNTPAQAWNMVKTGKLEVGYVADVVIAKKKSVTNMDSFFAVNPEDILMVISKGKVRLIDTELTTHFKDLKGFTKISVNGKMKYVAGNLPALINSIRQYYPGAQFPITF